MHPNEVVYFNRMVGGGIEQAGAFYDTDYWRNSYKQGVRWVESHYGGRVGVRKVRISSPTSSDLQDMIDPALSVHVAHREEADFYLGVTRLERHRIVPGEVVHTIRARGVPLLYIVRPDSSYRTDPFFAESPYMQLRLGDLYAGSGRLEEALAAYEKVLLLTTEKNRTDLLASSGVHLRLGNICARLERFDEALENYRKTLEGRVNRAEIYNNIGVVYGQMKDYRTAVEWLQQSVEIAPDYFMAYINLADIYLALGHRKEALAVYRTVVKMQPEDATDYYSLGAVYMKLGRYRAAEQAFEKALEIDPEYLEARQRRALARQYRHRASK